jgi:hypothetical protein
MPRWRRCRRSSRSSTRRLGRPSIAPERLLRALSLQACYSARSERQPMEELDYNLLFRWFVGLAMDAPIWDVTVFTKNRERLVDGEIARKFMAAVLGQPRVKELLSSEHFSVEARARCASATPTPHVAQNTSNRRSAIDGRTIRHSGYAISGRRRKRSRRFSDDFCNHCVYLRRALHNRLCVFPHPAKSDPSAASLGPMHGGFE